MRRNMIAPLLLAALLAACGERAAVTLPEVDAAPAAIARDQYRHLRARGDAVASKLKGAEPVWYSLYGRYKKWAALLAKSEALPKPATAFTELSYSNLDSELDRIERQADTFAQYVALRRSADYQQMHQLAAKFAVADREAARELAAGRAGDGEIEHTAMSDVLSMAYKLREGMRGLDAMRARQAALNKLQPDVHDARLMAAIISKAERSVHGLYGLDSAGEAFEALQAFAATEVRFKVDEASCSKLEVNGVGKGWYLAVTAIDANEDEIDYVTVGRNGYANVSPYFYLFAPKTACEQVASRLKDKVLAAKAAGTLGMRYPDGLPRFDLVGAN